jgi:hypothetical protein
LFCSKRALRVTDYHKSLFDELTFRHWIYSFSDFYDFSFWTWDLNMSRHPNKKLTVAEAQKLFNQAKNILTDAKARDKAEARKSKKKLDDRRKILAGACALSLMQTDTEFKTLFAAKLGRFLTRENERAIFPELADAKK